MSVRSVEVYELMIGMLSTTLVYFLKMASKESEQNVSKLLSSKGDEAYF